MDLLDTQRDEIHIKALNFDIDREDLRAMNSRLNYLSDLCPMGSDLSLKMTLSNDSFELNLHVKNTKISFDSTQNNKVLIDAYTMADQDIHQQILNWKKNRFTNTDGSTAYKNIAAIDDDKLE